MTRFYGIDSFDPNRSQAYKRFWLNESLPILKAEESLSGHIENDDEMYEAVKIVYGEDAASEALTTRKANRDNMKRDGLM
jgi:hypothetical protein